MRTPIIQDNKNQNFKIKNIEDFYNHILTFHSTGTSIHEEICKKNAPNAYFCS